MISRSSPPLLSALLKHILLGDGGTRMTYRLLQRLWHSGLLGLRVPQGLWLLGVLAPTSPLVFAGIRYNLCRWDDS